MKISKGKRQLAQLLIEAGVKQFPEGANWAAQDCDCKIDFYFGDIPSISAGYWYGGYATKNRITTVARVKNWRHTVLSRAEFDQVVAESAEQSKPDANGWIEWNGGECPVRSGTLVDVKYANGVTNIGVSALTDITFGNHVCGTQAEHLATNWDNESSTYDIVAYRLHKPERAEPQLCELVTLAIHEPVAAPTLDRLLQDYRNAADFAATKQAEADEAANMRDERWKAAQDRARKLGVHIIVEPVVASEVRESEPVITDWQDLRKGDVVWWSGDSKFSAGEYTVRDTEGCGYEGPYTILLDIGHCCEWIDNDSEEWRFIHRP